MKNDGTVMARIAKAASKLNYAKVPEVKYGISTDIYAGYPMKDNLDDEPNKITRKHNTRSARFLA